jgi:hypothetical protein
VVAIDHEDFDLSWDSTYEADIYPIIEGTSAISALSGISAIGVNIQKISVAGETVYMPQPRELVLSAQLLSTLTEASATLYYLYLTPLGEFYFDTVAPRNKGKKKGFYHPKYYWRNISFVYNNTSAQVNYFSQKQNEYEYYENGTGGATGNINDMKLSIISFTTSKALYEFKPMPVHFSNGIMMFITATDAQLVLVKRNLVYGIQQTRDTASINQQTKTLFQNGTLTFFANDTGNAGIQIIKTDF